MRECISDVSKPFCMNCYVLQKRRSQDAILSHKLHTFLHKLKNFASLNLLQN